MAERKSTRYLSVVAGVPLGMINNAIKEIENLNWGNGFYRKDIGYKIINK